MNAEDASWTSGSGFAPYFHSKLDSKCKVKGLLVQDLFEDGVTTNPRTKLSASLGGGARN